MQYYSTNKQAPDVTLEEAVVKGLAADKGLFMPFTIKTLPQEFYDSIDTLSFQEIAYRVADAFFGEDVPADTLKQIVYDTLSFDVPLVRVTKNIYSLELFHGPTLAFKDVGGRFMARLLGYFIRKEGKKQVNVLVATSGDTGSAVANGFLGVEGIHVYVLYPKGKVSEIQEKQFTTLGQNITAIEVDGTFDDCQALVKSAVTSVTSLPASSASVWDCPWNALSLPTTAMISSSNICRQVFIRRVPASLPLPTRWMWATRVTLPVYSTFTEAAMPPSLPKSAVPLIPTSRLPKPCGKCGRRTITCSTRTEPAASGPWPKD